MLLDIVVPDGIAWIMGIVLFVVIVAVWSNVATLKKKNVDIELEMAKKELVYQKTEMDLKNNVNTLALAEFEKFKAVELDGYKKRAEEAAADAAVNALQRWKLENEDRIRKDAANRSVRIVMGKVTEHLIPFHEAFSQFNPKDARFIGSPIDLIVFDGAEDKKDEITIYFLEIKTGNSALSGRQKKIMEAVKEKRVEWLRLNMKDFGPEVNEIL
jgi:predicted Holliday junction resolvase-like endonuclease